MVRISKQAERRSKSPRRPRPPSIKKEATSKKGQKAHAKVHVRAHENALEGAAGSQAFIPKIR